MKERFEAFLNLVKEMRNEQRMYFATREYNHFKKAKALEKRVDTVLIDNFRYLQFGEHIQLNLFDNVK